MPSNTTIRRPNPITVTHRDGREATVSVDEDGRARRGGVDMTPHAIERAWLLARAHGHHWADTASPRNLALGRIIIALDCGFRLVHSHVKIHSLNELVRYIPVSDLLIAPKTEEECAALSALPSETSIAVLWRGPDDDGVYSHTSGTGRTRWAVEPDGGVCLGVYRPGERLVLSAWIPANFTGVLSVRYDDIYARRAPRPASRADGPSIIVHSADWGVRHWEALPFWALGCSADHMPTEAEFADEMSDDEWRLVDQASDDGVR